MRPARLIFLLIVTALTGACTTTEWVNPSLSDDQVRADQRECHAKARAEANRLVRLPDVPTASSGVLGSDYDRNMAQYDYQRQTQALFDNCMETKGYNRKVMPYSLF